MLSTISEMAWIALMRDDTSSAEFLWLDGTPFDYDNWAPGRPSKEVWSYGFENVVVMRTDGRWDDAFLGCGTPHKTVCKIPRRVVEANRLSIHTEQ